MDSTKDFLLLWVLYETAKELREEAEEQNSAEQQAYIQPLFAIAFPELALKGVTYKNSWQCDDLREAITAWEESAGIEDFCEKTAAKNRDHIHQFIKAEREAEMAALNAALDMLEQDSKSELTVEQMRHFREKINAEGWTRERQEFIKYIQAFVDSHKS